MCFGLIMNKKRDQRSKVRGQLKVLSNSGLSSGVRRPSSVSSPSSVVSTERIQSFIRSRFNPIRTLSPQLLAQYLDEFKAGYLRSCALTFEAIEERDDTLKGVAGKRKKAAARNGWEILTLDSIAESQKPVAETHKQVLLDFYNNITVTSAIDLNQRGQVSLLVRQMMDAVGKQYAVHEIIWKPWDRSDQSYASDRGLTAEFRFVPLWFFENQTGALRFLPSEFATSGQPLDENGWLVTVGDGLMAACSVAYIYKTMSLKDWVIYNQRHGMPGIHGKTDAAKNSPEWDDLVTAVQNFAADLALVTNSGATIDKIDISTTGALPYPPLVERMDRALAALWRGADLSTMSGGKSDAGQGASLQGDETTLLEADDTQLISETLNMQVDKFVIEYHFGPGTKPLAYFKLKTTQRKNVAQELSTDTFLRDSGVPLSVKNTLERYNRPVPNPKDQLLTAPVPAIPPGQITSGDTGPSTITARPATVDNRPGVKTGTSPMSPGSAGSFANQNPSGQTDLRSPTSDLSLRADPPALGRLLAAARDQLSIAQDKVLQPLRAELEEILAAPDADLPSKIENLKSKMPALLRRINADPATVKVFEDTLSAALLSGLTEGLTPEAHGAQEGTIANFDPAQPRDEEGQWTDGAGGLTSGLVSVSKTGGTIHLKTPKTRQEASAMIDDMKRVLEKAHAEAKARKDPEAGLRLNYALQKGHRLFGMAYKLK